MHPQRLIVVATGQYIWKFPRMPHKMLKVLANPFAIIEISFLSLIGYGNSYYLVAIWEISTISP